MVSAHAAAVEAMAGALEWQRPMRFEQMARVALAALATSEAVRAALVDVGGTGLVKDTSARRLRKMPRPWWTPSSSPSPHRRRLHG